MVVGSMRHLNEASAEKRISGMKEEVLTSGMIDVQIVRVFMG